MCEQEHYRELFLYRSRRFSYWFTQTAYKFKMNLIFDVAPRHCKRRSQWIKPSYLTKCGRPFRSCLFWSCQLECQLSSINITLLRKCRSIDVTSRDMYQHNNNDKIKIDNISYTKLETWPFLEYTPYLKKKKEKRYFSICKECNVMNFIKIM